jgi:Flp pilus assembly protein TadD
MELTIEQALQQGVAAHNAGNLQEAERAYQSILQSQPKHPDANHNLGLIAISMNQIEAALPLFKTALNVNPNIEQFWISYIDALVKANQLKDAKQAIKKAKKKGFDATKLQALFSRSKANAETKLPSQQQLSSLIEYYQAGQYSDAEKLAQSITQQFPQHPIAWKALGVIFGQSGRFSESLVPNQKSVQLAPQDAEAHSNLGNTLKKLGRLDEALASYTQAIALKPDYAEAHSNLGITLQELGRLDEALAKYTQAIALKPDYAEAHSNLGVTLLELGRLDEALASYTQAIALKPDLASAHNNMGITLQELGRLDEALASYTQAIALKPDYAEAHRHLTSMKRFDTQDEQYSKMLELYLNEDISEEQRCHINFGLAKACEDLEDFKQAFTHYSEGNQLRKKLFNYDINTEVELFKKIKSNYAQIVQNSLTSEKFPKNLMPIFIVGMPRSGTTLVEQIISSHSQVSGAGELHFAAQFGAAIATGVTEVNSESLVNFRQNYLNKLQNVSNGNLIVTDKMPLNFRYIGLLTAAFPEAKIIHVKRNSAAVCWANYKQFFESKSIGYCYAIDDVITYHKLYENLMDFWTNKLSNRIYSLDYELLTVNQEKDTRRLIEYLGLDWDEKCLSPQNNTRSVATASNVQVRQKVYQGSSEQWRKYQPFLNGALDGSLLP